MFLLRLRYYQKCVRRRVVVSAKSTYAKMKGKTNKEKKKGKERNKCHNHWSNWSLITVLRLLVRASRLAGFLSRLNLTFYSHF